MANLKGQLLAGCQLDFLKAVHVVAKPVIVSKSTHYSFTIFSDACVKEDFHCIYVGSIFKDAEFFLFNSLQ